MTMPNLTCQQARAQLDTFELPELSTPPEPIAGHLDGCVDCRIERDRRLLLVQRLRTLPAPPAPAGYRQRMLTTIRAAQPPVRRSRWQPALALAATLALATGLILRLDRAASPAAVEIAASSLQLQPVRLVFNSPRPLAGVSLTVVLPEGAELSSHPGLRELSWTTDLKTGANVLELPLLAGSASGPVLATLRYGNAERHYSVALKLRRQPGQTFLLPSSPLMASATTDSPRVTT